MVEHNGYNPLFVPKSHRITITNKTNTRWLPVVGNRLYRAIANLNEVVNFVKKTYPHIPVNVIEWHKVPFPEQIAMMLNTTIFITPCGGASMIAPFLPHGASAIIMDYYVSKVDIFHFKKGASASMDGFFHNHFPHFRKIYYQVYGPQDYVFDYEGATNTRDDASILVNLTRLHLLMETAMDWRF
ncbi:unnamed protein product [Adineta steineri]|uniref:Glycosyltransferase 61 catalytic domain-containing protein n=1 Tax=Adineta steineri TaxID=433720 RepID=A0A815QNY0_9BILA|nr:unnamed protein product [Adineta steineri]CAF1634217.1 unnamed protein product [Adineta steineri]